MIFHKNKQFPMIYLLHILLGSFISRCSHSNPCSCHHTGARCTFSAKKSNTAPIVPMGPVSYTHLRAHATSQKEAGSSFPVQLIHFVQKQVPSRCALYLLMSQEFECQYNACSVRNQCVSPQQSFCKGRIFQCCVIRVRIDGVNQQFAFGQCVKLTSVSQKRNCL